MGPLIKGAPVESCFTGLAMPAYQRGGKDAGSRRTNRQDAPGEILLRGAGRAGISQGRPRKSFSFAGSTAKEKASPCGAAFNS